MKFQTLTIGSCNKFFFLNKFGLEILILKCLKNKRIYKHTHIGYIPIIRILIIRSILFLNKIPLKKFNYKAQLDNLKSLSEYKKTIAISSSPIVGAMTILECWKYKIPVLIFNPKRFYINYATFLEDKDLLWETKNEFALKLELLLNNYKKYSHKSYSHFKFLINNKKSNDFLLKNTRDYNKYFKDNEKLSKLRLVSFIFKIIYFLSKVILTLYSLYLLPILSKNINQIIKNFSIMFFYLFRQYFRNFSFKLLGQERINIFQKNLFNLSNFLFKILFFKKIKAIYIKSKKQIKFGKELLYQGQVSTIATPYYVGEKLITKQKRFDNIYSYHIKKKVIFSGNSSCFLVDNTLFIDDIVYEKPEEFGVSTSGLLFRDYPFIDDISKNKELKIETLKKNLMPEIELDKGIFIGGCGTTNWYHWVLECLPKLFLSDNLSCKFNDYPLLVPEICKEKNFQSTLEIFNEKKREVIYLENYKKISANKFIYIDGLIKQPFQKFKKSRYSITDYDHHDELLLKFSKKFSDSLQVNSRKTKGKSPKKIFLSRKKSVRNYNQNELLQIAYKYGFESVFLEELSLKEQIELISETSHIVGPSGAAWTCLVFNSNKTLKCLSWLPNELKDACAFSAFAYSLGHDLRYILMDEKYNEANYDFHLDSYYLDPVIFEKTLIQLLY